MRYPIPNAALDAGDIAILGRKGSGKTYTAKGLVERLIRRGRRVIVIDPMSIWWGLRLGTDGLSPGLPVLVLGGKHGDLPLDETSREDGAKLGKFLLETDVSAVVDVADVRRPNNLLFVAGLLNELYERHEGEPIWIVLEEADIFAPQNSRTTEDNAVFAEVEILARRGRSKGFRLVSITQRPARLHKDVLSQLDTMAVLGLPGLQDRRAIRDWMEGVVPDAREVFNTLPTLPVGEAWIWTPRSDVLVREKFPTISTFDTSRTPDMQVRRLPLGSIDAEKLAALKQSFLGTPSPAPVGARVRLRRPPTTAAGAAMLELRKKLHLSQAELAKMIGSEQKAVSRMESGRSFVSTRILERIAACTGHKLKVEFVPQKEKRSETSEA